MQSVKRLIIMLLVLAISPSCVRDNDSGCNSTALNLVFMHDASAVEFDRQIANDVHLQIYLNGLYHDFVKIPYRMIEGGKPFRYTKTQSGNYGFVAWAVPHDSDDSLIPARQEGELTDQILTMSPYSRNQQADCIPSEGRLLLGTLATDEDTLTETNHVINMEDSFCTVTVRINDADLFSNTYPGLVSLELEGTSSAINVWERTTEGPEALIHAGFEKTANLFTTSKMSLLPAVTPQSTVVVHILTDNRRSLYLDSKEVARAGKDILIEIDPINLTAEITVDGWGKKLQVTPL